MFTSGMGQGQSSQHDEGHPRSRSKLHIGNPPGRTPPAHVASNDMPILEYALHDCYMAHPRGTLNPGLEYNNGAQKGPG